MPPAVFFFLKIAVAIQSFVVSCKFQDRSTSVKNTIEILIEIALNLQIALSIIDILTILILLIHEYPIYFHLFASSISFFQCLTVFSIQDFHILIKFNPTYFILFDVIGNGIIFLISLSDSLLLPYRNAADISVLVGIFQLY